MGDESSIKDTEEDEDDPEDVFFNKHKEEDENDSSNISIRQSYFMPTSTPPISDSEDDEDVYPVAFINEATEHHPNSHFLFEQSPIKKSKIIKVERDLPDVTTTP